MGHDRLEFSLLGMPIDLSKSDLLGLFPAQSDALLYLHDGPQVISEKHPFRLHVEPMKIDPFSDSKLVTRRRFLRGISASGLLLAQPRALAGGPARASLRELAGGKPLM